MKPQIQICHGLLEVTFTGIYSGKVIKTVQPAIKKLYGYFNMNLTYPVVQMDLMLNVNSYQGYGRQKLEIMMVLLPSLFLILIPIILVVVQVLQDLVITFMKLSGKKVVMIKT